MNILKDSWNSPLKYFVSLLNIFFNTNIINKKNIKLYSLCRGKMKNTTNVSINDILFGPSIVVSITI